MAKFEKSRRKERRIHAEQPTLGKFNFTGSPKNQTASRRNRQGTQVPSYPANHMVIECPRVFGKMQRETAEIAKRDNSRVLYLS